MIINIYQNIFENQISNSLGEMVVVMGKTSQGREDIQDNLSEIDGLKVAK